MTFKESYVNRAMINSFLEVFDTKTLVKDIINNNSKISEDTIRKRGIILKNKKELKKDDVLDIIRSSMIRVISDDKKDYSSYIAKEYNFDFNIKDIDEDFIQDYFSVKLDKKYIYIDIEM